MLAVTKVPDYVNDMYASYKKVSDYIYAFIKDFREEKKLIANTNIYEYAAKGYFVYIVEGYFKLHCDDKIIRWYSQSDFIFPSDKDSEHMFSLISEFATVIDVFEKNILFDAIKSSNDILEKWIILQNMENKINISLGSAYLGHEVKPEFALKEYKEGDLIMQEGEKPTEIFEMISGSATAIHNDEEVGTINEGEVFGEISFLAEKTRTATVKASEKSLVRVINEDDFLDLIKYNPQFIISISKTLAHRIIQLNEKVSEQLVFIEI